MATLAQFFPYVLPHVAGCPEPLLEQALRAACIEFCTETLLVQELTTATMTATVQDYDVEVPNQAVLVKVIGVLLGDAWLPPASIESVRSGLALRGSVGSATAASGTPTRYFQKTPTAAEISLYPVPAETIANWLVIRAAFAPSRTATVVDDVLFQNWAEEIAAGAIARLAVVPGQSFTNPSVADAYRSFFNSGARSASIRARTGKVAAASRVQPVRFA